jgi:hypothetical protein
VKRAIAFLAFITSSAAVCSAQGDRAGAPLSFPDSVRLALENTRSLDASVVGAGFFSVWPQLSLDQQLLIKKQSNELRRRRFPVKTHVVNYFGAIVNAVSIEKIDAQTFAGFLTVVDKVIEKGTARQIQNFFSSTRSFFQFH